MSYGNDPVASVAQWFRFPGPLKAKLLQSHI